MLDTEATSPETNPHCHILFVLYAPFFDGAVAEVREGSP